MVLEHIITLVTVVVCHPAHGRCTLPHLGLRQISIFGPHFESKQKREYLSRGNWSALKLAWDTDKPIVLPHLRQNLGVSESTKSIDRFKE